MKLPIFNASKTSLFCVLSHDQEYYFTPATFINDYSIFIYTKAEIFRRNLTELPVTIENVLTLIKEREDLRYQIYKYRNLFTNEIIGSREFYNRYSGM